MEKVLYFDDDPQQLKMLTRLFSNGPFEIICVNAQESNPLEHEIVNHDCSSPDAPCKQGVGTVISDYNYDRQDGCTGITLLEKIRDSRCTNNYFIRLILLSAGFPIGQEFRKMTEHLLIRTLDKPYTFQEILAAIQAKP